MTDSASLMLAMLSAVAKTEHARSGEPQVVYRAPGVWQFVAAGGKPLAGAVAVATVGAKGETP